jgi:micrococcal nuclease
MTDRAPSPFRTRAVPAVLVLVPVLAFAACGSGAGAPSKQSSEEAQGSFTSTTIYGPEYLAPPGTGSSPPPSSAPASTVPRATATTGASRTTTTLSAAPAGALPAGHDTTVTRVTDGDTIVVGGSIRVRLIGMDTPETHDPRTSVQCFGPEASRRTSELLPAGTPVRLVYDVDRTDRYGRTLAYVYRLSDGVFVNIALVRDGFAQVATYPPNVAHVDEIRAAEAEAREAGRGLWGDCPVAGGSTAATAPPTPTTVTPAPPAGGGACDPSYPDVCIPPAPPDLDCGQIAYENFRVVGADPHRFDGNHDGMGCESS